MNKLVIVIAGCVGLLAFTLPAAAQDLNFAEVFPDQPKVAFDHWGNPRPFDHEGNTIPDPQGDPAVGQWLMPWYWHPRQLNGPGAIPNIVPFTSTVKFDLTQKKMSCIGRLESRSLGNSPLRIDND